MKRNTSSNNSRAEVTATDLEGLDAIRPEDIDLEETPEVTPEMFARAVVRRGGLASRAPKAQVTIRVDVDVLEWFRSRGRGYQTEMSDLLRAYMEEHKKRAS